jgi:hypothetical protein
VLKALAPNGRIPTDRGRQTANAWTLSCRSALFAGSVAAL